MYEKERIDYLAHISKAIVELSPMERPDKDLTKRNIDFASELLKLVVKSRTPDIVRIQEAAQRFNLDRVTWYRAKTGLSLECMGMLFPLSAST